MAEYVVVPHERVDGETLEALLEEFITREGTDYGLHEHSLEAKKQTVRKQLERGHAVIVFDPESESVSIVTREELKRAAAEM